MKTKFKTLFILLIAVSNFLIAQNKVQLVSPNGSISFSFDLVNTAPAYSVGFKNKILIENSPLSLEFADDDFGKNISLGKPVYKDTTEDYDLVVGKTSHVHTHYKEVKIPLQEKLKTGRKINFIVRVFDDGIAFRYEIPEQDNWTKFELMDENTTFKFKEDPLVRALLLPNYTSSHEGLYTTTYLSKVKEDTLIEMPALFEFSGNIFMAITEAELVDYAGM